MPASGLTLVEVMISMTLLGLLMSAVLSSFIFILRGEQSLANYNTMNAEARTLLELLGRDSRSATDVTNFSASSLTLVVPQDTSGNTQEITYEYDGSNGVLFRQVGSATERILIRDITSFNFNYFNGHRDATTSLAELKQVQLTLRITKEVSQAATSQYVISAQYTLRAKPTSH
ncbi:MAG: prepilin-type N-terminal cleavage/methylation domain-containing protein [Opitutaceae bacterium]|nr:prepilin-type N-terminal cleavage/methylation domain-containing protein [Opitutaceae bacterium]